MKPIVFRTVRAPEPVPASSPVVWRVETRSLGGMQKEAVVSRAGSSEVAWRMMSDEGPYLKGKDLAPPPLAYFSAGLQFCLMAELRKAGTPGPLALSADTRYTMDGSILRGDMKGGALPAEFRVPADPELVAAALKRSPAEAVVRDPLHGTFSLSLNGKRLPIQGEPDQEVPDPGRTTFRSVEPVPNAAAPVDIITRVARVKKMTGVEGGVASALKPEQSRQLHLSAEARELEGSLKETVVRILQPRGSSFRFRGDDPPDGSPGSAPPALASLCAGVAFCFMTQLGRYAQIVKLRVTSIRTVQFHGFEIPRDPSAAAVAAPVETHAFVEADEPEEKIRKLVSMGAQTCFLHAAMRGRFPSVVEKRLAPR